MRYQRPPNRPQPPRKIFDDRRPAERYQISQEVVARQADRIRPELFSRRFKEPLPHVEPRSNPTDHEPAD